MKTNNTPSNEKRNRVINDFGQKIGGAHKDRAREAAARLYGVDAPALIVKPLGQVAKLPDLRALYASGVITEETARRAWYLWSQIGQKPGSARPWRVSEWAEKAAALIAAVADTLAYGVSEKSQLPADHRAAQSWELFQEEMTAAGWPAEEYKRGAYFVGRHWMGCGYSIHSEKSSYSKQFETVAEAVAAIREKVGGAAKSAPRFSLYKTSAGGYFITPEGKSGIKLFEFEDRAEALAAYRDTEKLAARYNELRTFPSERRDWNRPRVGADHRHGQDLSPEAFAAVFPFRGVEFGNWVNQIERAACLNECADALHDLAAVLGIIPEAVTLGGSLAWAFGSRGVGRAAAHYESARRVVNLTKRSGNGCVAHEWFHALDNYLMIEAGRPHFFAVDNHRAYGGTEKSQIQEAARLLKVELLNSQMKRRSDKIDTFKSKPYWGTVVEMAARGFEAFIYYKLESAGLVNDYLVSFRMIEEYDRPDCYPYPTREEAAELAPYYEAFIQAAFGDAERLNGADPEAEAAAYGEAEKSQPQELPAPPAAVVYDPAQPVERAEFHTVEEAPAVAASLPMDADNPETSAPTGAAYVEAEKSQPQGEGERYAVTINGQPYGECEKSQREEMKIKAMSHALCESYMTIKEKHPGSVILYRTGDFYSLYRDDAKKAAEITGLIVKESKVCAVSVTFPAPALDTYLPKLVRAGLRCCICDAPEVAFIVKPAPTHQDTPTAAPEAAQGAAYGESQKSQKKPRMKSMNDINRQAAELCSYFYGHKDHPKMWKTIKAIEEVYCTNIAQSYGFAAFHSFTEYSCNSKANVREKCKADDIYNARVTSEVYARPFDWDRVRQATTAEEVTALSWALHWMGYELDLDATSLEDRKADILAVADKAAYGDHQKSQLCTVTLQVEDGPDGVAEYSGPTAEEAVRDMWYDDEEQNRDGLTFTIEGQRYTYQSVAMHYCFDHGRITFEEMLEMCKAE